MPDPIVPLTNAPASTPAPSPAAAVPGGGSPQVAAPAPVAGTTGAPVAGTQVPAPAAQPTAVSPPPPPPVDPRDAQLVEWQAKYEAERTRAEQFAPYAQIGYQTVQQRQQQAPVVQPTTPTAPKPIFNITPFDDSLKQFITYNAEGQVTEKPGAPPGTAAAYQRHLNDKAAALDQLLRDPTAVLAPILEGVEAKAAERAEKNLQTRVHQAQREQSEAEIFQANKGWLCNCDSVGNPLVAVNPLTGEKSYQFTPDGRLFLQHYQQLVRTGLPASQAATYATSQVAVLKAQEAARTGVIPTGAAVPGQPASPLSQQVPPVDPRQAFIASIPGGSPQGNQPPPQNVINPPQIPAGPSNNAHADARRIFAANFRAAGLAVQ